MGGRHFSIAPTLDCGVSFLERTKTCSDDQMDATRRFNVPPRARGLGLSRDLTSRPWRPPTDRRKAGSDARYAPGYAGSSVNGNGPGNRSTSA